MEDNQFEVIVQMLQQVLDKQEIQEKKLDVIMEQTATNTEMKVQLDDTTEMVKNALFEIELIKKYIRS